MAEGKFEQVSWQDFASLMEDLMHQIQQIVSLRGVGFDAIVGISTGGLAPTAVIANKLDMKPYIMGIKYYKDIELRMEKPEIFENISSDLHGKHVLLVDDIADTGKTIEIAKDYLYAKGALSVVVVTLHYKPHCAITPDAYVQVTDRWIVYPWEKEVGDCQ